MEYDEGNKTYHMGREWIFNIIISFTLSFFYHSICLAKKLNFEFGFYDISATNPINKESPSVKIQSPGNYSFSFLYPLTPNLEIGAGYSVFFSKIYSGDMGFGPDFVAQYYPFGPGTQINWTKDFVEYKERLIWRPYLGLGFFQRQFQSVQSSYSGFGFSAGCELQQSELFGYLVGVRSLGLIGPSNATMNYMDLTVGIQIYP